MSFNFGGPVVATNGTNETAAQRENRDVEQRGGDQKYTEGVGLNGATLTVVGAKATGGRTDREFLKRNDDRNDRIYVDGATGVSALSGEKGDDFDELKAGPTIFA